MYSPSGKIFWAILKLDKRVAQTDELKDKGIEDDAHGLTPERSYRQTQYVKKRRKESSAWRTVVMQQFRHLNTKNAKKH